jgi:signal transduction histidine kinase
MESRAPGDDRLTSHPDPVGDPVPVADGLVTGVPVGPRLGRTGRGEVALDRELLTGVAVLRWATWIWMAVIVVIDARDHRIDHLWAAIVLVGVALAFTAWATVMVRTSPGRLLEPPAIVTEMAIAGLLVFGDPWVYNHDHSQSLGSAWPLAVVITVGIAYGVRLGASAGFAIGVLHWLGQLTFASGPWDSDRTLGAWSTIVLFALAGAVAGFAARRLREAERQVSDARAREEVARTLHDGVLQTLAVVQRRSDDDQLVALARDQELDLRNFLFGLDEAEAGLGPTLRAAAARAERTHGLRTRVVLVDEPRVTDAVVRAVGGAVTEALTNAAKHGGASQATVYVESQDRDGLFCSIKDDGTGFDVATVDEGVGLTRSIRGRVSEVGGRVEVDGRPGRGAEVRVWVP